MWIEAVADRHIIEENNSLSVVIPVYNQERNIAIVIERITKNLDNVFMEYEVVIVNDGSNDGTLEVLQRMQKTNSKLKIISYAPNKGKGFAVKTGVLQTSGSIVLFMDGDLDVNPDAIQRYIMELKDYDLVIASKAHKDSRVIAPLNRKFLSKGFNALVKLIVGIKVKDTQAGMKAGRGTVMRKIFGAMMVKRYAFDVELLAIASRMRLRIAEMPVQIIIDRNFKIREIYRMFMDLLSISYRLRIGKQYKRKLSLE